MLRALVDQHRDRLQAAAEVHRLASSRGAVDVMWIDGTAFEVRPIALDDAGRLSRLFSRLSSYSRSLRFLRPVDRVSREQVSQFVEVDHDCREALVASLG